MLTTRDDGSHQLDVLCVGQAVRQGPLVPRPGQSARVVDDAMDGVHGRRGQHVRSEGMHIVRARQGVRRQSRPQATAERTPGRVSHLAESTVCGRTTTPEPSTPNTFSTPSRNSGYEPPSPRVRRTQRPGRGVCQRTAQPPLPPPSRASTSASSCATTTNSEKPKSNARATTGNSTSSKATANRTEPLAAAATDQPRASPPQHALFVPCAAAPDLIIVTAASAGACVSASIHAHRRFRQWWTNVRNQAPVDQK